MDANKETEIIIGTYEDYVVGYQVERIHKKRESISPHKELKTGENGTQIESVRLGQQSERVFLEQSFAVRGHSGSVRCLSCTQNGSFVFTAGQDEMMNLFNLKKRKLMQTTEGAVSCANFVENSHLICGSDDGNIYIHECSSTGMKLVKTLRGHKAGVLAIDTHQSGKVLLSLSRDKTMRTWNLIKGRCAYVTHIGVEAHIIKWIRDNDGFLIGANREIYLYNNLGCLMQSLKLEKRVNVIEFIADNIFATATDSGTLSLYSIQSGGFQLVKKFDAHKTRIKSVRALIAPEGAAEYTSNRKPGASDDRSLRIATASSDGLVKLWSIDERQGLPLELKELASVDIGARLTCMIVSERNRAVSI